jgi:hypothetical protein
MKYRAIFKGNSPYSLRKITDYFPMSYFILMSTVLACHKLSTTDVNSNFCKRQQTHHGGTLSYEFLISFIINYINRSAMKFWHFNNVRHSIKAYGFYGQ